MGESQQFCLCGKLFAFLPSLPVCTAVLAQISVTFGAICCLQLREAVAIIGLESQQKVWKLKKEKGGEEYLRTKWGEVINVL